MSFGNFSSYLAKKNCQQQNYCCLQGPSGERGPEGAKGDTGLTGPGVPNENFVFGLTSSDGLKEDTHWLVPGGQISKEGDIFLTSTVGVPPSMAVGYNAADISVCAIHINGGSSATFKFTIYAFCAVTEEGMPSTDISSNASAAVDKNFYCQCLQLSKLTASCQKALAVTVRPTAAIAGPISISIALYSQTKLGPPP
jgi:hypothetical protein